MNTEIPRRPWVISEQMGMNFVLSQDNDILLGDKACKYLGKDVVQFIVNAVNAYDEKEKK